jgi:hypothetical protein
MEKQQKPSAGQGEASQAEVKKTPVIIQLTDDQLEEVVGAGRCPPSFLAELEKP